MKGWASIVRATVLEILSEPLSLLLLMAAHALATLAPAFHYHQFGEPTRMARDAGLSALLTMGLVFAVFGTVRSLRREIETLTLEMALAHPISRAHFFFAKTSGAAIAVLFFALVVGANVLTVVNGAAIGGAVAQSRCDIARLWGPSLTLGVANVLVPLVLAAAFNRFAHCRFVLTFFVLALPLALAGSAYRFDASLSARLLPVMLPIVLLLCLFVTASAAFAVRLKIHAAVSLAAVFLLAILPFIGNYYRPDSLAEGGSLSWAFIGLSVLVTLPAIVAFSLIGVWLFNGKDVA